VIAKTQKSETTTGYPFEALEIFGMFTESVHKNHNVMLISYRSVEPVNINNLLC
jgi:hypothetical protein